MAVFVDLIEPNLRDLNDSVDKLGDALGELYSECWNKTKKARYDKIFNLNVNALVQMWVGGSLRLFTMKDDGKSVGFLVGMVFRPIPYAASVFQIEEWYVRDGYDEKALFDYVTNAVRFMGCDEIWVSDKADGTEPELKGWHKENVFQLHRYTK